MEDTEVRIYDYVDPAVPMLQKMFERRLRAYRAIGYEQERSVTSARARPRGPVESAPQLPILPEKED